MTLPRLAAMESYWESNPPVHQLIAAYMGYKKPEKPQGIEDFAKAMGAFNG